MNKKQITLKCDFGPLGKQDVHVTYYLDLGATHVLPAEMPEVELCSVLIKGSTWFFEVLPLFTEEGRESLTDAVLNEEGDNLE